MVAAAIGVSAAVGVAGSAMASSAAHSAGEKQQDAATASLTAQEQEYNNTAALLAPYNQLGTNALNGYGNLTGANGAQQQEAAIEQLQQSPLYQSQMNAGKQAILQSASATGGLRGGNAQLSLAGLGQSTLASTIQQQIGNLQGASQLGLNAATQTGVNGMNSVNGIVNANAAYGNQVGQNAGQQQAAIGYGANSLQGAAGYYAGLKSQGFNFATNSF